MSWHHVLTPAGIKLCVALGVLLPSPEVPDVNRCEQYIANVFVGGAAGATGLGLEASCPDEFINCPTTNPEFTCIAYAEYDIDAGAEDPVSIYPKGHEYVCWRPGTITFDPDAGSWKEVK